MENIKKVVISGVRGIIAEYERHGNSWTFRHMGGGTVSAIREGCTKEDVLRVASQSECFGLTVEYIK